MMCARSEDDALARGLEGANFFGYSLAHFYVFGDHVPARTDVWQEFLERRGKMGYSPEAALAAQQETLGAKAAAGDHTGLRGAIGTPAQLREFLRRYEAAGVDQLIFVMQAGHNRHEDIMESIELFGTEVLPEFVERDEAAQQGEGGQVGAAHRRRPWPAGTGTTPIMPTDYVMRAIPKQMVDGHAERSGASSGWRTSPTSRRPACIDEEFQRLIDG